MTRQEAAQLIDHAVLDPGNTESQVVQGIQAGLSLGVKSVCVYPNALKTLVSMIKTDVTIASVVVNFPHGCGNLQAVEYEVMDCVTMGAGELDIVVDQTSIASGCASKLKKFAERLIDKARGIPCKFILECGRWSDAQIKVAAEALVAGGANFLKTSTGYGPRPTLPSDVRSLFYLNSAIKLKAAGGIKDRQTMETMLRCGADRIGTSSTAKILSQF